MEYSPASSSASPRIAIARSRSPGGWLVGRRPSAIHSCRDLAGADQFREPPTPGSALTARTQVVVFELLEHLVGGEREHGMTVVTGEPAERVSEEGLANADGADDGDVDFDALIGVELHIAELASRDVAGTTLRQRDADVAPPPSAGVAGRMLREPAHDVRHLLLEAPGYGDVEDARALRGPVLEVVRHAAGREDERPRWGVDPAIAHQDAHGPLDHVEDVVLVVGVRARPLRVRLEPPFRDRVPLLGLGAVGQEAARDAAHRIRSPAARREEHALPRHAARMRLAAALVLEKSSGAAGAPCRRSRARGSGGSPRPCPPVLPSVKRYGRRPRTTVVNRIGCRPGASSAMIPLLLASAGQ